MAKGHMDKVAVITGAANGIGQAFAKRLAEDGVHIAVVDVANGADTHRARAGCIAEGGDRGAQTSGIGAVLTAAGRNL